MFRRFLVSSLAASALLSIPSEAQVVLPEVIDANGPLHVAGAHPGGGFLVAGAFNQLNDKPASGTGRYRPDGEVWPFYDIARTFGTVNCFAQLAEGRFLIGGNGLWSTFESTQLLQVDSRGTVDPSFPGIKTGSGTEIRAMRVLPDGSFLVAGDLWRAFNSRGVARFTPDGNRDVTFNPHFSGITNSIAVQSNGRIVVGGSFGRVNHVDRAGLARLHPDGTLDYSVEITLDHEIHEVALDARQRILAGGSFSLINGQPRQGMFRLLADGSLDPGFQPTFDGEVHTLVPRSDGGIFVGGSFQQVNGVERRGLALLREDGSLDPDFVANADGEVRSLVATADGRLIVAGSFEAIGGVPRRGFAVLGEIDDPGSRLVPAAGGGIVWRMAKAAPELRDVALEIRTAEGWQDAGPATRTAEGWQFAVGTLPENRWLRARGRSGGGLRNGSDWIVETRTWLGPAEEPAFTIAFDDGPPLVSGWEVTDFGTVAWPEAGAPRTLTLTNTGTTSLDGFGVEHGREGVRDFEITGSLGGPIPVGGSRSVEIAFRPYKEGPRQGELRISGPAVADEFLLPLTGTGSHVDLSFAPSSIRVVRAIAIQADRRILVGGEFSGGIYDGVGLIRLHPDGSRDGGFAPRIDRNVHCIAIQEGGRIVIGGSFSTVEGQRRPLLARLLPDGSLDPGFAADGFAAQNGDSVDVIAIDGAGRILVGGKFTEISGAPRHLLARLLPDGTVDPDFFPQFGTQSAVVDCVLPLEDGGVLVGGSFQRVDGVDRAYFAKLDANGRLDPDFGLTANQRVHGIVRQPDGGLVLFGEFSSLGGEVRSGLARLNADGTLDPDYRPSFGNRIEAAVVDERGRMILGQRTVSGDRPYLFRLLADGSLDERFDPGPRRPATGLRALALQDDGQVLIGGGFSSLGGVSRSNLARVANDAPATASLTRDGAAIEWRRGGASPTIDHAEFATWDGRDWVDHGPGRRVEGAWRIEGPDLPDHSWIRARGRASGGGRNGSAWVIEQIEPYGSLRPDMEVALDGEIALPGADVDFGEGNWLREGPSRTFTITNTGLAELTGIAVETDTTDFVVTAPPTSVLAPGESTSLTVTFMAQVVGERRGGLRVSSDLPVKSPWPLVLSGTGIHRNPDFTPSITGSSVSAIAEQEDGAIVIGGSFSAIDGEPRPGVARFAPDGSLDSSFRLEGLTGNVHALAVQPDGRILVGGSFSYIDQPSWVTVPRIIRLLPDGTRDPTFIISVDYPVAITLQPDGRILVGGSFNSVNGEPRSRLARLMPDGSLDPDFAPVVVGFVSSIVVQEDGRILIGGNLTSVNGEPRRRVARLHPDGTLDMEFAPVFSVASSANSVTVVQQRDGGILVAADFFRVNGVNRNRLVRLHRDGSLDMDFLPAPNSVVRSLVLQADGSIFVGGEFTQIGGAARSRLARLRPDGSLDPIFNTEANATVRGIALAADGSILVGGDFGTIGGVARERFARLHNSLPGEREFTRGPGGRLEWRFSGSGPAPAILAFDAWDGGEWVSLGEAARVGDSWVLEGAVLPTNGWLRARALVSGAAGNSSSTLLEVLERLGEAHPEIEFAWDDGLPLPQFGASASFGTADWLAEGLLRILTITNRGSGVLDDLAVTTDGPHASDIVLESEVPGSLAVGESTQVRLRFVPRGGGPREARLNVRSNAPIQSPFLISLTGQGIHIDPSFDAGLTSFGSLNSFVPRGTRGSFLGGERFLRVVDPSGAMPSDFSISLSDWNNMKMNGLLPRADGTLTFGGNFWMRSARPPLSVNNLMRLLPDYSTDVSFDAGTDPFGTVWALHPLADGRQMVGGEFHHIAGVARRRLARLLPDGTVDPTFDPNPSRNDAVVAIAAQSDGKIVIGWRGATPTNHVQHLTRLNPDGTADPSFDPPGYRIVNCVAVLPDDRILVSGVLSASGLWIPRISRLHPDGSPDPSFALSLDGQVHSMVLQADGSVLVGGTFLTIDGRAHERLARILADGSIDPDFNPKANGIVRSVALDGDGNVLVGGAFTSIGGVERRYAARLPNNIPALREFRVDAAEGRLEWLLGGSSPECLFVHFEIWNGERWSPLGRAERIAGGWRLENVDLPDHSFLRAVGVAVGGDRSASAGYVEQIHELGDGLPQLAVERADGTPLIDGEILDFGEIEIGESAEIILRVRNVGGGTLDRVALTLDGMIPFSVLAPEDLSLAQGESADIHVRFQPTVSSPRTSNLRLFSNDPRRHPAMFPVTGLGLHPPGTFGAWPPLADLPLGWRGATHRHGPMRIPNRLAYAMDLPPLTATPADLPASLGTDPDGKVAIFRYRRAKSLVGTTLRPETSPDLATWQAAEVLALEVVHDGGTWETVVIRVPMPPGGRLFFRLRAE